MLVLAARHSNNVLQMLFSHDSSDFTVRAGAPPLMMVVVWLPALAAPLKQPLGGHWSHTWMKSNAAGKLRLSSGALQLGSLLTKKLPFELSMRRMGVKSFTADRGRQHWPWYCCCSFVRSTTRPDCSVKPAGNTK
jgi:hypothetical protein